MTAPLPPAAFEAMLRRAGRRTRIGACAIDDLRREHAAWYAERGRLHAAVRYAFVASALSARLHLEGRRAERVDGRPPSRDYMGRALLQDLRYGVRSLLRAPAFTATAALTFALGVGATTAIFAAVHAILLRPLPYPEPGRLVSIDVNTGGEGWYGSSMPEYFDFAERIGALEQVGAYTGGSVTMGDTLAPTRVRAVFASASLLPVLGVEPALGRLFTASEETPDNNRFVVLSDALWRQAYAADPAILGRTVTVGGDAFQVVGVMPPGFAFPDRDVRAWIPFGMSRTSPNPRNNHFLTVVGRLKPGETVERAAAQLEAYTARAREAYPEIYSERGFRARIRSLHTAVVGEVRAPLTVLFAAVVLVLLIACVNVANLLLGRAEARQRELSVRAALGASSGRLVRQLVTESLLLAAFGGAAGLLVARGAALLLVALAPASIPRLDGVRIGWMPVLLALGIIAVAGLIFGVVPALRAVRSAADGSLARGGRGVVARRSARRLRRALVSAQVALACVIVVGAGLMMRTLRNLQSIETGFDPDGVLTLAVTPSFARYAEPERRVAFWDELLTRLETVPGVHAVGATNALPLSREFSNWSIRIEGLTTTSIGDAPDGFVQFVTPGLFDALGLRLLQGRTFTAADRADASPAVIVNRTFAERFWPGEDPIGKTMRVFSEGYPWLEVVGVVADIPTESLDEAAQPMWYVAHAQAENTYGTPLPMFAVLRVDGDPTALLPAVRQAIREQDPTAPISRVATLESLVGASIAGRSFTYDLLRAFGLVAVLLACVGVYGVATLAVAERRAEIGLRKALGASGRSVLGLVAREILVTVAVGALVGLGAAFAGTRLMASLLYGVGVGDPVTLGAAVTILFGTALLATLLPAASALRVDPLGSLRNEV